MKFIYKPFAIVLGLIAGQIGRKIFESIWGRFAEDDPRDPDDRDGTWAEILISAAIGGAILKVTQALVRRGGAKGFERATGFWPGDEPGD